jgi:S1-C subfamily serine protease
LIAALLLSFLLGSVPLGSAQQKGLSREVTARLEEVLSGRRVDKGEIQTRGRRDLFSNAVKAVPFVISRNGKGSSVVIQVNQPESTALVVTNHHVVDEPFRDERGRAFVMLLFYDPQLASEPFSRDRVRGCQRPPGDPTAWCKAFQQSLRPAFVVGTDIVRDLALLYVRDVPKDVGHVPPAQVDDVQPGDEVSVVGHPLDLLWSLTTGIVSAVRRQFPTGTPPRVARSTVIQTQTPVNPGNSGGPLLTAAGRMVGVIFGQGVGGRFQGPSHGKLQSEEITIPAAGLNFAIAINEVQNFVSEWEAKVRQR